MIMMTSTRINTGFLLSVGGAVPLETTFPTDEESHVFYFMKTCLLFMMILILIVLLNMMNGICDYGMRRIAMMLMTMTLMTMMPMMMMMMMMTLEYPRKW